MFVKFITVSIFVVLQIIASSAYSAPAVQAKAPLSDLAIGDLPDWGSEAIAIEAFELVRDKRFIKRFLSKNLRRISWMYPLEGCYNRAELVKDLLDENLALKVKKIFIFGDLEFETPFSQSGSVHWWYHVAAAFRIGDRAYVIDPSIDPYNPLLLSNWAKHQVKDINRAQFSLCHADTYMPRHDCLAPSKTSKRSVVASQKNYLRYEARNLKNLGFSIEEELGDKPYWKRP